jgi:Predicted dehydrogenase
MHSEVVIIGAGVIGLAIGKQLSESGFDVTIIEKWPRFGEETSSRNSEVIHAGIYYPQNSLKAKFCADGNASIYEFADNYNISHRKCGKLIIAQNKSQISKIESIYSHANRIGARDLEIIDKDQIQRLEPNLNAEIAIYSPSSGIIDSHAFMSVLEAKILNHGSQIIYNHELIDINKSQNWDLTIQNKGDHFQLSSNWVINCAGLLL